MPSGFCILWLPLLVSSWRVCDVSQHPYDAVGDGVTKDSSAIRTALDECDEVWLPRGRSFLSGPVNLTSNQVLRVDGTLLASTDKHDYALIAPLMGYGWGDDENCFPPDMDKHKIIIGSLRYTPVVGAYHATNVTITGSGTIDGQGQSWWENCSKCHYTPGNDSRFCEIASRPKLIETQYVDGFRVIGSDAPAAPPASVTARAGEEERVPDMQKCRVTTSPYKLAPSSADKDHPAYDAYIPSYGFDATGATTTTVTFAKHERTFCGNADGAHSHHAPIAFGNSSVTLAQCQKACADMNSVNSTVNINTTAQQQPQCTCVDYLEPPPAPTPPTPPPPSPAPPSFPKTLTLQNSPFWTVTPSYTQNIHVRDVRILAPMDRIGNTDGVNLDSCRDALVENVWIQNSDDGVCIKSGLDGFGLNLGIPTENVLVRNITCAKGGRGGFAIGSEMSGGMRNITYRDSALDGERGIDIKPSVGRGGYIFDLTFANITGKGVSFGMGRDGVPLMPGNDYVPLVAGLHFVGVKSAVGNKFDSCHAANLSKCFDVTVDGKGVAEWDEPAPAQTYGCKRVAKTMFGTVDLPWPVCIPHGAPVNLRPDYPNYGPAPGDYATLAACKAACK